MGVLEGAIIGCGFFARNHLHAWGEVEGARLVAVCDADAAKAEAARAEFGAPRAYTDAAELFTRERLDFVDIATTPPSHRALVALAARHGVPVICQKPMAETLDDARAMVAACAAAGVPFMVHENFRFQTPLMAVRAALDEGAVGEPFFGRVSFRTGLDVFANQPYLAEVERLIILDLGIHVLDVARFLFGEVTRIACQTARAREGIRGEDAAVMLLGHEGGAASVVDCTYSAHRDPDAFPQTLVEVDGRAGSLVLGHDYWLTVSGAGGTDRRQVAPRMLAWATPPWHLVQESVRNTQQHWIDCLRAGRTPATAGADNLKTFALVEAAYEAAAGGHTVQVSGG